MLRRVGSGAAIAALVAGFLVLAPLASPAAAANATVHGQVTAVLFGNAVSGASVVVVSPTTGFPITSGVTDGSGNYSISVPPGSGLLLVADPANNHVAKLVSTLTTFPDGGDVTVNVQLNRYRGGIEGRITDSNTGDGIPTGLAVAIDHATGRIRGSAVTDGFGFWVIRNLRGVSYDVQLFDLAGAHDAGAFPSPVNVVGDALQVIGTTTLSPRVAPSGSTVSGTLTEPGGAAVTTAAALVYDATTQQYEAGSLTNGAGQWSADVDAGTHVVRFVDTGSTTTHQSEWFDDQRDGDIGDATVVTAPATANAVLGPATGTITGTVTEEGTPTTLSGVLVAAVDDAGIVATTLTGPTGAYTLSSLPAGPTRVWFGDPGATYLPEYFDASAGRGFGHDTGATTVSVTGGGTATADASLIPAEAVAPTATVSTPAEGATFGQDEAVTADFECADAGSGIDTCVGDVADGEPLDTSTLGAHTFSVTATDLSGNTATTTHNYSVVDQTDPTVTLTTPPDDATYDQGEVVDADYSCDDETSLSSCVGDVADGAAIDTSTPGAQEFSVTAMDAAGNTTTVTNDYTVVDGTDPTVTLTTPPDGATYTRGESVDADYSCDDDVDLDTCVGDVADGSPIDTSELGAQEFSVTATDTAGNSTTVTNDYTVVPATCFGEDVTVDLRFDEDPTNQRDVILGTPGDDEIRGLRGDDLICGGGGEDDIRGGAGRDRIRGGAGDDLLRSGPDGGLLAGNADDDHLVGGTGKDTLRGGAGNDDLVGGAGNDLGDGGPDEDTCFLWPGRDTDVGCEALAIP